jgi:5-methylcytosine-specific restriction endonuclease McrA
MPKRAQRRLPHCRIYGKTAWRHVRRVKLLRDPLCEFCRAAGHDKPATVVDHIIPRSERPDLAYSLDNLRSCCVSCHNRRTRLHEGGKD